MHRPRNRQPRVPRQSGNHPPSTRPSITNGHGSVPNTQQVQPGASVSIVLKSDQPTGHETSGVVKDLLTRGNHPRGIKVRLLDGQIGRVQRMLATKPGTANSGGGTADPTSNIASDPPPRSLADFITTPVKFTSGDNAKIGQVPSLANADIKCPICGVFEGDEAAVSHHVQTHLE